MHATTVSGTGRRPIIPYRRQKVKAGTYERVPAFTERARLDLPTRSQVHTVWCRTAAMGDSAAYTLLQGVRNRIVQAQVPSGFPGFLKHHITKLGASCRNIRFQYSPRIARKRHLHPLPGCLERTMNSRRFDRVPLGRGDHECIPHRVQHGPDAARFPGHCGAGFQIPTCAV